MAFDALRIAQRSMIANQAGLLVTGENIANAASPGYSRQQVILTPSPAPPSVSLPQGVVADAGDAVTVQGVRRVRNAFLDDAYRVQNNVGSAADERQQLLDRASAVLEETDASGLSFSMTGFLQNVQKVSVAPQDLGLRTVVLSSAQTLASDFRTRAQGLQNLGTEVTNKAQTAVADINNLLKQLAASNTWAPSNTTAGNEGLDQRDRLLDQLSEKIDVQATTNPDGTLTVYQGGVALVYGKTARTLQLSQDAGGNLQLATDTGRSLTPKGGTLSAYFQVKNSDLASLRTQLDQVAAGAISEVNRRLGNGYDLQGLPGGALFVGTNATDIQVSSSMTARGLGFAAASLTSNAALSSGPALDLRVAIGTAGMATATTASGVMKVNGVDVAWNDTMTTQQILDAMPSGVKASFDSLSGKVTLMRDPSAGSGPAVTVSDVSGNLSSVLKLSGATMDLGIPGDGTVAQSLATLSSRPVMGVPPSRTLAAALQDAASGTAAKAGQSKADFQAAQTLRRSIDDTRQGEFGVNTDEEGVKMLQYQRSYEAAVRLASTQDALLDTLINRMGR